jgi:hypothetical protein
MRVIIAAGFAGSENPAQIFQKCLECGRPSPEGSKACEECGAALPPPREGKPFSFEEEVKKMTEGLEPGKPQWFPREQGPGAEIPLGETMESLEEQAREEAEKRKKEKAIGRGRSWRGEQLTRAGRHARVRTAGFGGQAKMPALDKQAIWDLIQRSQHLFKEKEWNQLIEIFGATVGDPGSKLDEPGPLEEDPPPPGHASRLSPEERAEYYG